MRLCECGCGKPAPIATMTNYARGQVKGQPVRFIRWHYCYLKHGMYGTPEFLAFHNARVRCTNPKASKFKLYGGRGIKFLFTSFEQWFKELGPRPQNPPGWKGKRACYSVDRINNDGNYEPGNVRWATQKEQVANRQKKAA